MLLGVHCSIRNGFLPVLEEARDLTCSAAQIFSYRRHQDPDPAEIEQFRMRCAAASLRLFIHARYLPHLAFESEEKRSRSEELLIRELRLAQRLGAESLVVHVGAYAPGSVCEKGADRFVRTVAGATGAAKADLGLVLENVPGGGRRIGGSLEELAQIGERAQRQGCTLSFCLDTAHAWAYGYALDTGEGMGIFLERAASLLGKANIRLFHLNDSLAERGSHRENHWHWGQGRLGPEGLRVLLRSSDFKQAVGILETPKGEGKDQRNLEWVRRLMEEL